MYIQLYYIVNRSEIFLKFFRECTTYVIQRDRIIEYELELLSYGEI